VSDTSPTPCGYTWPPDHEVGDHPDRQSCCCRPTLDDADYCAWHVDPSDTDEKTIAALKRVRTELDIRKQNEHIAELLDGAIVAGIEISNSISLSDVSLRDTNLRDADLIDTNLRDSDLTDANLRDADLTNADLTNADLRDADLRDADLTNANLRDADLTDANLRDADFTDAYLRDADLTNADLRDADLRDADLTNADLTNADLRDADLTDVDLAAVKNDLSDADFKYADLKGVNLREVDLTDANLRGVDLTDAILTDAKMSNIDLRNATLANIDCSGLMIDDVSSVKIDSQTRISSWIPLRSGFRHRPIWSSATQWARRAQGYEKLRKVFEQKGINQQHRKLYSYQRRARAKTALRSRAFIQWVGNYLSRILIGHGVMVTRVLFWTVVVILVPWYWYGLIEGCASEPVNGCGLRGGPLYYSIVTFVTSPPNPPPYVEGRVDLLLTTVNRQSVTQAIVLFQTYVGTALIILLGYVLGNRDPI
jgi:uncharacterized protein YjbI with pentapeptide repeats